MKATKIKIKNLFGIKETELDGKSIELSGTNGTGKTSVIDAIRYALTNNSERDYVVRNGETEGEILIETDTGLVINRKKRTAQSDYKSVRECGKEVPKSQSFLNELFTPIQLNPVEFTQMSRQEQNRAILDLIEFKWDLNWIQDQFGEIPKGIDYEQNILKVLHEIQKDGGDYFLRRQDINRDIRNKKAFIADIVKDIPDEYDYEKWNNYDLSSKYQELNKIREQNNQIEHAKTFRESYDNKLRGIEAEREIRISSEKDAIAVRREDLKIEIERLKNLITQNEKEVYGLDKDLEQTIKVIEAETDQKITKLQSDMGIAAAYSNRSIQDTTALEHIIKTAEGMFKHLNEYKRMIDMQKEVETLKIKSGELTEKIELARELPAQILKEAVIPVEGLSIKEGIPLIHGLPVSNLSEGEKLKLCVDIAIHKPNALQIILLDGTEKLSDENRFKLYEECKNKGLQFIATRTTNNNELEVVTL